MLHGAAQLHSPNKCWSELHCNLICMISNMDYLDWTLKFYTRGNRGHFSINVEVNLMRNVPLISSKFGVHVLDDASYEWSSVRGGRELTRNSWAIFCLLPNLRNFFRPVPRCSTKLAPADRTYRDIAARGIAWPTASNDLYANWYSGSAAVPVN